MLRAFSFEELPQWHCQCQGKLCYIYMISTECAGMSRCGCAARMRDILDRSHIERTLNSGLVIKGDFINRVNEGSKWMCGTGYVHGHCSFEIVKMATQPHDTWLKTLTIRRTAALPCGTHLNGVSMTVWWRFDRTVDLASWCPGPQKSCSWVLIELVLISDWLLDVGVLGYQGVDEVGGSWGRL